MTHARSVHVLTSSVCNCAWLLLLLLLPAGDVHVIEEEILQFYRVGAAAAAACEQACEQQQDEQQ
jgi:hypothetical protein